MTHRIFKPLSLPTYKRLHLLPSPAAFLYLSLFPTRHPTCDMNITLPFSTTYCCYSSCISVVYVHYSFAIRLIFLFSSHTTISWLDRFGLSSGFRLLSLAFFYPLGLSLFSCQGLGLFGRIRRCFCSYMSSLSCPHVFTFFYPVSVPLLQNVPEGLAPRLASTFLGSRSRIMVFCSLMFPLLAVVICCYTNLLVLCVWSVFKI